VLGQVGGPLPRARRSRPSRSFECTSPAAHPDTCCGGRADSGDAEEQVVSAPDRARTRGPGHPHLGGHGDSVATQARPRAPGSPRRRRRTAAQARHHQGLVARAHDPHRCEEGRPHPRRRRLAHPRHQLRPGPRRSQGHRQGEGQRDPAGLRLPALRSRWVLPSGLHRGPRGRDREDRDRVPLPCPRLVRRPRRHPLHPDRDRQRLLLSRQGLHPRGVLLRRAPSADQALHAPPQRQGGAIPADPGQRTALRPPLAQRRPH
jgi:hypothetical protein